MIPPYVNYQKNKRLFFHYFLIFFRKKNANCGFKLNIGHFKYSTRYMYFDCVVGDQKNVRYA
jgi:hypothetical protein